MTKQVILSRKDGHLYDAMSLKSTDMPIEHIAWNLAHINRYNGAQPIPINVAAHSLLVSSLVPEQYAYAALMHDVTEAVVGDIAHSIKFICPDFQELEKSVLVQLAEFYSIPTGVHRWEVVKQDVRAREIECLYSRGKGANTSGWDKLTESELRYARIYFSLTATQAAELFVQRYERLRPVAPVDPSAVVVSEN
jgi:hypothetical protein